MYLFVFIFVILSVLGLYTELFTLRMASVMAQQKVAAESLRFWHGGVATFVSDNRSKITIIPGGGCLITLEASVCGLPIFTKNTVATSVLPNKVYLPTDYNIANDAELLFRTRLFTAGTGNYVLTYVNANEWKLGFTADQIYRQMKNAKLPAISYGRVMTGTCMGGVSGHWLATQTYSKGVQVCYDIPVALNIADGAVGIISKVGP